MMHEANKECLLLGMSPKISGLPHDAQILFEYLAEHSKNQHDGTYCVETFVPTVLKELTKRTNRTWVRSDLVLFVRQLKELQVLTFEKVGPEQHKFTLGSKHTEQVVLPHLPKPQPDRFKAVRSNPLARKALDEAKTRLS
jgi:hypothetical protein